MYQNVGLLSRFVEQSKVSHFLDAKWILLYVSCTIDHENLIPIQKNVTRDAIIQDYLDSY